MSDIKSLRAISNVYLMDFYWNINNVNVTTSDIFINSESDIYGAQTVRWR